MTNQSPGSGAVAQAVLREERWREVETSGAMLSEQVLTGLDPATRRTLIGVRRPRGMRYPGFQIVERGNGFKALAPSWTLLRDLLAPAGWSDEFMLLWTLAPNAYLNGRSPAEEIQDDPDDVSDALRYAVERAIPSSSGPEPHTRRALGDFLSWTDTAARLVARGRVAYDSDEALRLAAETILRRISASVARLDAEFIGARPSVNWRKMLGLSDDLAAESGIDEQAVWDILEVDLPSQSTEVRRILREAG